MWNMRHERDPPRVAVRVALADEHREAAVDAEGDLGVAAAAEDRQRAGVGVEQQHFVGGQREGASGIVGDVPDRNAKSTARMPARRAGQRRAAKLNAWWTPGKILPSFSKS